jgi:TRAP-type C4-dicarboxylate transport system permease small subunit
MTIATTIIVVIAEDVLYWRSLAYPEQQYLIVPLIMFLIILAIILNLWRLMKRYHIDQ